MLGGDMDRKNWNSDADLGAQNMLQAFRISASRETGGLWVRAAKAAGLSVEAWACSILDEAAKQAKKMSRHREDTGPMDETDDEFAKWGLKIVDWGFGHAVCVACRRPVIFRTPPDGDCLPTDWWICPNGCNRDIGKVRSGPAGGARAGEAEKGP